MFKTFNVSHDFVIIMILFCCMICNAQEIWLNTTDRDINKIFFVGDFQPSQLSQMPVHVGDYGDQIPSKWFLWLCHRSNLHCSLQGLLVWEVHPTHGGEAKKEAKRASRNN